MDYKNRKLIESAEWALRLPKYYNSAAHAGYHLGVELINRGETAVGRAILEGTIEGLFDEADQEYPVCPNCGKRHPPPDLRSVAMALASKIARVAK